MPPKRPRSPTEGGGRAEGGMDPASGSVATGSPAPAPPAGTLGASSAAAGGALSTAAQGTASGAGCAALAPNPAADQAAAGGGDGGSGGGEGGGSGGKDQKPKHLRWQRFPEELRTELENKPASQAWRDKNETVSPAHGVQYGQTRLNAFFCKYCNVLRPKTDKEKPLVATQTGWVTAVGAALCAAWYSLLTCGAYGRRMAGRHTVTQ
jgi:hypothetical protein